MLMIGFDKSLLIPCVVSGLLLPAAAAPIVRTDSFAISETGTTTYGIAMPLPRQVGDTATNEYEGQVIATYTFDPDTLEFSSFTFANESTQSYFEVHTRPETQVPPPVPLPPVQNYQLQFLTTVDYPVAGYNGAVTYVVQEPLRTVGQDLIFRPKTIVPVGSISPSGSLVNDEHVLYAYSGNKVTARAVATVPQPPVRVDYSLQPQNLRMRGTYTPVISVIASSVYSRTAVAVLGIKMDERDPVTLPGRVAGLDLVIDETEVGYFYANTAIFSFPTSYGQWANGNGLSQPQPEALNDAGIAYAILFALDLPASADSLPIVAATTPTGPVVTMTLPEGGLLNPMSVEYSESMETWSSLPGEYYLDGEDSLDLGKSGAPRFGFPGGARGFLRFGTTVTP